MGGNMHGCSYDTPATFVAPASRASEVVRLVGLDSENIDADANPPQATDRPTADPAVGTHITAEPTGWTVL